MSKKKTTVPDHQTTDILGQLKENPKNPRTISKDKFQKLKKSILDFPKMMELRPIIYDKDKIVLGGNMRLKALRELVIEGLKVKPEYFKAASDLTKKEIKQFIVADNLPFGAWDFDLLAGDYSIEELIDFGFDEKELDLDLWQSEKTDEQLDDAPEPQKTAISKTGDIFLLGGKHKLLCGDSTKKEDVEKLMDGKKADLCFTDPPYNVDYEGGLSDNNGKGLKSNKREKLQNDAVDLYPLVIPIMAEYCNGAIYTWFAGTKGKTVYEAIEKCGQIHSLIIWVKNGRYGALNANYKQKHEPCLYWKAKNKKLNFVGGTTETTIWEINKDGLNKLHPTQKPVALAEKAIKNHSVGLILDLFLGSGSTLIACEQTNRILFGCEIDPIYVDVSIRRYHKLYPDKPIECLTNKNFNFKKLYEEEPEKVKKGKIANE